jgi:hypothetical protein
MALSGSWRNELIAPGPLSAHHAHLIGGGEQTPRCAQCHAAANASLSTWTGFSNNATSPGTAASQSTLCMACHDESLPRRWATAAHNIALGALRPARDSDALSDGAVSLDVSSARRDAGEPIACAACHREHQGRGHDLTAIGDAACQACHRDQYDSFAKGHPDFGLWPYKRRTRIVFDHSAHQLKHHPAEKRPFACGDCHEPDATGAWQLTRSYSESCAECHDKPLMLNLDDGVPLVSLPTLDRAAMADAGHHIGIWPDQADGDFDGAVPWPAKLLMSAQPQAAAALEKLGSTFDFYDVNPEDEAQLTAAAVIAHELRSLIDDLAARGQSALVERMAVVVDRALTSAEVEALAGKLSHDFARRFRETYFAEGAADASADTPQEARLPGGGWIRDDATLSLRYQPTGHADPWLRAWLDVLAAAATGPRAEIAEPLLREALRPTALGQCGSCHSVERDAAGGLAIQWRPRQPASEYPGLTHFSHASHTLQTKLRDCTACHAIAAHAAAPYATDDPRQFVADFAPLSKSSCVKCHTPNAAGDSCTQCHRYHGGGPMSVVSRPLQQLRHAFRATDNRPRTTGH